MTTLSDLPVGKIETNFAIIKAEGTLIFMLIAVLVLIYQVFMVDRYDITALKRVHRMDGMYDTEGMEGMEGMVGEVPDLNPGANRSFGGISSGQWQAGGLTFDHSGSAGAGQLAKFGNKSPFFGGSEAPVFYSSGGAGPMTFGRDYRNPGRGGRGGKGGNVVKGGKRTEGLFQDAEGLDDGQYQYADSYEGLDVVDDGFYDGLDVVDESFEEGLWQQQTGY